MAKKKVTKKEVKDETILLKLLGAIINTVGLLYYTLSNIFVIIASIGVVITAKFGDAFTKDIYADAIELVSKAAVIETLVLLGSALLFELLNYIFYLQKQVNVMLAFIGIEVLAFIVVGCNLGFDYIQGYVTLLPAITGIINYFIITKEGK